MFDERRIQLNNMDAGCGKVTGLVDTTPQFLYHHIRRKDLGEERKRSD